MRPFTWLLRYGWLKIRWDTFAHTAHWLRGLALINYLFEEEMLSIIKEQLYAPNPLIEFIESRRTVN